MNYLGFALIAYLLNAVAVTIDKFLITKKIPDPLVYIFYFSLMSLLTLFLVPFVSPPPFNILVLAFVSTLLWTTGAYFMFSGLKIGQVSRVVPVIGTLIPIFLLIHGIISQSITPTQTIAVILLIIGLVFLTVFSWRGKFSSRELIFEFLAGLFFASSYLLLRQVYLQSDFITILAYSRLILIPTGILLLLIPITRRKIFPPHPAKESDQPYWKSLFKSKIAILFGFGQIAAGISEFLITFSISLATPALVNSLQGVQYVFLFLLSLGLSKKFPQIFAENLKLGVLTIKLAGIVIVGLGLYLLAFGADNQF